MRRLRKISLRVVGVALGLAVAGWLGLHWYLGTSSARKLASEKVSAILGMPVEVTSLDVGFRSTTVGIVIPDSAANPPTDFVKIGSINTDITLTDLVTGSVSPSRVTARDVEFTLRLDANRKIVSPLPKLEGGGGGTAKLPAVKIENARFRILQPGKPDFDVTGINASLTADGDGSVIGGDVSDPQWGKWVIAGRLGANPADGRVTFTADDAPVSDARLQRIPFVKSKVWKHFTASGSTTAKVTLAFKPDGDLTYAVDVHPKGATVHLPDAFVTLDKVDVAVRIADGKVKAEDGTLDLAGGQVKIAGGEFIFDQEDYILKLKATASGVDVKQLPEEWGLKKKLPIEGKLRGNADLRLLIGDDGKLETGGTGSIVVTDPNFLGGTAEITMKLVGENGRYRFDSMSGE